MSIWRALTRGGLGLLTLLSLASGLVLVDAWSDLGHRPVGERRAAMEASPQWGEGGFVNAEPMWNDITGSIFGFTQTSPYAEPSAPLPVVSSAGEIFDTPPSTGLRVTWLGHSTTVIEIDGHRLLTDPIWGERASPVGWAGPRRWYDPPMPLSALPPLDAILISHDHYDHLQYETIRALKDTDTVWITPLGVGAHLAYWGVPEARIVELDWWQSHALGDLTVHATPARHASGRQVFDQNRTLWAGYALVGPEHRVFFSGDTGLFSALKEIGARLGPFDVTMLEIGAYFQAWPDWHLGPEQAVTAHDWLGGGGVMLPIHWGLWSMAMHGWTEPAQRVVQAAGEAGVTLAMPRPGESVQPGELPPFQQWWPDEVPWQTASEAPIIARGLEP
jgi:L-ascorbate metabolism protein UlaG (beta-lactamase superfamily)